MRRDTPKTIRFLSVPEGQSLRRAMSRRDDEARASRTSGNLWRTGRDYGVLPDIPKKGFADSLTPAVLVSLNTGLRRGELTSLNWTDIDLAGKRLTVRAGYAKSGKARHIPLNREALDALKRWHRQNPGLKVFPISDAKRAWSALLAEAKIAHFQWQDLRHDFAARLVIAGVDLDTVRELLGHSGIKAIWRYAHLAPKHKAEQAVERLVK